jgi:hypothetical protein
MGQCSSYSDIHHYTPEELVRVPIGKSVILSHGCGPDIDGTDPQSGYYWLAKRGMTYPTQEFEWDGMAGPCKMCSDPIQGYGCTCNEGDFIMGAHGSIKRTSYLGDLQKCCQQQKQIVDGLTCDPDKYPKQCPQIKEHFMIDAIDPTRDLLLHITIILMIMLAIFLTYHFTKNL